MPKKIILFLVVLTIISVSVFSLAKNKWFGNKISLITNKQKVIAPIINKIDAKIIVKKRALQILPYLQKNKYSDSICFIINMAIPSGKPRFFVYNYNTDSIIESGLVTHGSGSQAANGKFEFKNYVNCNASSKGKYKIGESYMGKFGLAYKLYGLDSTNNKAFERFVVLHSHDCVPLQDVYPSQICVSQGCPTVAPQFLQILQPILKASSKPIILDISYTIK